MKFGILFANAGPFGTPEGLVELGRAAEEAGVESVWTVEHVVVPAAYESRYPYSRDGRLPGGAASAFPDPLIPLAFLAAETRTLRLGTGILILPQRHPTYVAKEVATLDGFSHGRVELGVGIGWLEEEFRVVGVPFAERAARTEESILALRSLWADGTSRFDGQFFRWPEVHSEPKPVQRPGVPVHVGGHSHAAARRAARCGDGFFPAKGGIGTLTRLLGAMREECDRIGRDPGEIEITASAPRPDLDTVLALRDLGVQRVAIAPPGFDRDGLRRGLESLADSVMTRL